MALSEEELAAYLKGLSIAQVESIGLLRALISECDPGLEESICADKWYSGLLVFRGPSGYPVYALGPKTGGKTTFHMMPYYCAVALQEQYGAVLRKFMTGKSCLACKHAKDLPIEAIRDIVSGGSGRLAGMRHGN